MKDRVLTLGVLILALAVVVMAAYILQLERKTESLNWSYLNVLVNEKEVEGTPFEGAKVQIKGKAFSEETVVIAEETNHQGICQFGPVKPDQYTVTVSTSTTSHIQMVETKTMNLYGGRRHNATFALPKKRARITPNLALPKDVQELDYLVFAKFETLDKKSQLSNANLAFGPNGKVYSYMPKDEEEGPVYRDFGYSSGYGYYESPNKDEIISLLSLVEETPPLNWPATDYRCAKYSLYFPDKNSISEFIKSIMKREADETVYAAASVGENVWDLRLPEDIVRHIREENFYKLNYDTLLSVDVELGRKIPGKVRQVHPVARDCSIRPVELGKDYDWRFEEKYLNIVGPAGMLLDWGELKPEDIRNSDIRFFLAIQSWRGTTEKKPSQAQAHEVLAEWREEAFVGVAPDADAEPFATFDIQPGLNWVAIEITSVVRSQFEEKRKGHGVLLRLADEKVPHSRYSGHTFSSRESEATGQPVLLVVEKQSE